MAKVVISITDMPDGTVVFDYDFGPDFVPPQTPEDVDGMTRAEQCGGIVAQFLSGLVLQSEAQARVEAKPGEPEIFVPNRRH